MKKLRNKPRLSADALAPLPPDSGRPTGRKGALARKLRDRSGFSLVELLLCVMLLVLTTGTVVRTLNVGVYQFQQRTQDSEAEILCNSLCVAVRDRLTYATKYTDQGNFNTAADGLPSASCGFAVANPDTAKTDAGQLQLIYQTPDGSGEQTAYWLVAPENYILRGADGASLLVAHLDVQKSTDGGDAFAVTVQVSRRGGALMSEKRFRVYPRVFPIQA